MKTKNILTASATCLLLALVSVQAVVAKAAADDGAYVAKQMVGLDDFPAWFKKSLAREKVVKSKSTLKIKELNVNSKVKGKIKLIEKAEGVWYYNIDTGLDSPVECYVFQEYDGPANSLYGVIDNALTEGIPELHEKPLSSRFNFAIGSGVSNNSPYLLLDTLYTVGEGEEKVLGVLKGLSTETETGLQMCMHNGVGYRKTFFSVFESFVAAVSANESKSDFFDTIVQFTLNDVPVGFSRERFAKDSDGDVEIKMVSSMLMPVDPSSISRTDSNSTSWSSPDGALINENVYSISNSALDSDLSIKTENDKWKVIGELQGKEVAYELEHDDWLISNYGSYAALVDLKKSDQKSAEYNMWMADVDPSSAFKIEMSKIEDNPEANYKMNMGPLVINVLTEDNGTFLKGTMEQGPIKMKIKQVYSKGEPSLP